MIRSAKSTVSKLVSNNRFHQQSPESIASVLAANDRYNQPIAKSRSNTLMAGTDKQFQWAMSQGKPGHWVSDHRKETTHYTGWHYVAIRTISIQAAMCEVNAYRAETEEEQFEAVEKALRWAETDEERRYIAKKWDYRQKSYSEESDKGLPLLPAHRLMRLLKRPNPKQSGASFRFEQAMQLGITGTSLIWHVRNAFGLTVARYIIPTAIAQACAPSREYPLGYYRVQPEGSYMHTGMWHPFMSLLNATQYDISAGDIQVVRWPHPLSKDDGQSTMSATSLWTDSANKIDTARFNSMDQGAEPKILVTLNDWQGDSTDLDRVKQQVYKQLAGEDASGGIAFLANSSEKSDINVEKLTTSPEDMDYGTGFEQMRDSILASHGVPPLAAGIEQASGREGLYAPLEQFAFLTIQPLLTLMAEEDTEFLAIQFGDDVSIEYTATSIKDGERDRADRQQLIDAKAMTIGELRLRSGMELFGDERDDEMAGGSAPQPGMMGPDGMPLPPGSQPPGMPGQPFEDFEQLAEEEEKKKPEETLTGLMKSLIKALLPSRTVDGYIDSAKVKHYPGGQDHDQDSHAGGGGGGEGSSSFNHPVVAAIMKETVKPMANTYAPDPEGDEDGDGVTDNSRVGVGGSDVPPPPDIPRMPNLTADERIVEELFATAYEDDPDGMAAEYEAQIQAIPFDPKSPLLQKTYNTDDAKMLSPDYKDILENRSLYNISVHQTANAIAKRAFRERLDAIATGPDEQKNVLITQGGVAAGKGFAVENSDQLNSMNDRIGAVWDAAGEQNGTEMVWIQKELDRRGIKGTYVYVHIDPVEHKYAGVNGVIGRAAKKGRMVDSQLFAESYELSAKNFKAHKNRVGDKANFIIIDANGKVPKQLDHVPDQRPSKDIYREVNKRILESDVPDWVKRGANIGRRIWQD